MAEGKDKVELQKRYIQVFQGDAGVTVLSDILSMLGYFSNMPERIDPERIAIANTILSRLNVFGSEGVNDFVRAILGQVKMPVWDKEDDDEL